MARAVKTILKTCVFSLSIGVLAGAWMSGGAHAAAPAKEPVKKPVAAPAMAAPAPAAPVLAAPAAAPVAVAPAASLSPPTAQPGQCFARVTIPERAENYDEVRIIAPARTETRDLPAVFEDVPMQVLVKEPAPEWVVVPGVYRTVTETQVVAPARTEPVVQPAITETYVERVMVRPAYVTWKEGSGLLGRPEVVNAAAGGSMLCRVEVPAEYARIQRVRVVTPERTVQRAIPAVTRQVSRQELVTPARMEQRMTAPVYRTEMQRRLVRAATQETVVIPEVRRTERLRRVLEPARTEWREVLCGTNASKARLAEVQRALTARGYATPSDGVFGPSTLAAMEAFQRANGLATGYLTIETVRALGVAER